MTAVPDHLPPNPRDPSPAPTSPVACRAYAKVNLCLAVAPPEPPGSPRAGWHRIASWFHAIDLWDDVELLPATSTSYHRSWAPDAPRPAPIDWPEDKDLAVRAHRLIESLVDRPLPIELRLTKRIPTGGGLGGGSSDAAAVMVALNTAFSLALDTAALRAAAARLGSDVAYFIPDPAVAAAGAGSAPAAPKHLTAPPPPAIVTAFGDQIAPAARAVGPITLILPPFGCATPAVYKAFDTLGPAPFRDAQVIALAADPLTRLEASAIAPRLFNDLAPAAEAIEPRLAALRRQLEQAGHTVHMSGSGSTLFLIDSTQVRAPAGSTAVPARLN